LSGNDGLHLFSYVAQNTCLRVLIIYFFWLVIFFLYRPKVLLYVSFFTIGHSATFILVVPDTISINSYLIDAIALSMVYKGFDNLGGFKEFSEPTQYKSCRFDFRLFQWFRSCQQIARFQIWKEGLFTICLGLILCVEIGQFIALTFVLILISLFGGQQLYEIFNSNKYVAYGCWILCNYEYQLTGYFYILKLKCRNKSSKQ
jgi:hypothetical protein